MGIIWFIIGLLAYAFVGFLMCLVLPYFIRWFFEVTENVVDDNDYMFTAIFWPLWLVAAIFAVPFQIAVRQAKRINQKLEKKRKQ